MVFVDFNTREQNKSLLQARLQLLAASAGGAVAPGSRLLSQHPLCLRERRVKSLTSHISGVSQEKHCLH